MNAIKHVVFSLTPLVALLGTLEVGLWIAGVEPSILREDPYVGFAADVPLFTLQQDENGEPWMRTAANKRAFFNDQRFPVTKSAGTRRIFCLGGSTTYGRPYRDSTSFCGWLREGLRSFASETDWEVINAGGISYASYRVAALMRELNRYAPDLFIVYSGHNEFLEERTYRSLRARPAALRNLDLALRRTRTYTALEALLSPRRKPASGADGRDQLSAEVKSRLDSSIGPAAYHRDDELAAQVIEHYRLNLERMTTLARGAGAEIVFVVPADNLRDCAPFRSEPSESLSGEERAIFDDLLQGGERRLRAGELEAARESFEAASALDPRHADARYRLGRAFLALGDIEAGAQQLARARDEDVCPLRALSPMADVVRHVAARRSAALVDFPELLAQAAGLDALPRGGDWFLDHVHPTIEGHALLARSLLSELVGMGWVRIAPGDTDRLDEIQMRLRANLDPVEHGIALRNLAKVLSWAGKSEEAARLAQMALGALGEDAESLFILAVAESERGAHERAVALLLESLRLDPGWLKARHNLGAELARLGRKEEALRAYDEVLESSPSHPAANFNRANVLSSLGRLDDAIRGYRDALAEDSEDHDARFNLAGIYERNCQPEKALAELRILLKMNLDDAELRRESEAWAASLQGPSERAGRC